MLPPGIHVPTTPANAADEVPSLYASPYLAACQLASLFLYRWPSYTRKNTFESILLQFLNELGRDFGSASQAGNASGSGQGTANGSQSDPDQQGS